MPGHGGFVFSFVRAEGSFEEKGSSTSRGIVSGAPLIGRSRPLAQREAVTAIEPSGVTRFCSMEAIGIGVSPPLFPSRRPWPGSRWRC
ncbi:hypothetical protein D8770_21060 [Methylobacterium sp. DB1607]|nr:hypothetical protein [Methylobacterium sp. DB1607]